MNNKYPIEFVIRDDNNNEEIIATIKASFEDDTLEINIDSFLVSDVEDIDKLAESLKQCLIMYQG